ncbi:MAG: amidohydrolase [Hungatella sp.]|nr:amidohydrolase [Hungatella sp.]
MRVIIYNGIVVTMNEAGDVFFDGYVVIEGTRIVEAGPGDRIRERLEKALRQGFSGEHEEGETAQWVDACGAIIMPGMVNTHCHMSMIPFRGLGDDCKDRLRVFLLPMEEKAMDREMAVLAGRYGACELLLDGVTTVMDMYYYAGDLAGVMEETGIRGIAGETVMDQATCDAGTPEEAIDAGKRAMEAYKSHERVRVCLSPHGTTTCSPKYLRTCYELAGEYGVPFTLHTAEMDYEMAYLRDKYGCGAVEFLDRMGVLGAYTLAAHAIQVSEKEISLMKERGASAAHCIASNTKAAKGVAPVRGMLEAGVAVGLGSDGPASGNTLDLFTQMRFCANFHKNELRDRSAFPAKDIVAMATIGGARALGLEKTIGSLEPGKEADLVLVETDSVNMFPVYDPYAALVYSAGPSNVSYVYVAGQCLVKDKKLVKENMEQVREALVRKMKTTEFGKMGGRFPV